MGGELSYLQEGCDLSRSHRLSPRVTHAWLHLLPPDFLPNLVSTWRPRGLHGCEESVRRLSLTPDWPALHPCVHSAFSWPLCLLLRETLASPYTVWGSQGLPDLCPLLRRTLGVPSYRAFPPFRPVSVSFAPCKLQCSVCVYLLHLLGVLSVFNLSNITRLQMSGIYFSIIQTRQMSWPELKV